MIKLKARWGSAQSLLETAPVDDGSRFEDLQAGGEIPPLVVDLDHRGLQVHDGVDGSYG